MNVRANSDKALSPGQNRAQSLQLVSVILVALAVFMTPVASAQIFQTLYTFHGPDGWLPNGVIPDAAGNLYGTTTYGGTFGYGGTVFKIDPSDNETVLHSLNGTSDGAQPIYNLTMDSAGNLYGVALFDGDLLCSVVVGNEDGCGTVFKVDQAGNFTVLHAFGGDLDPSDPTGPVIVDTAGNVYGVTGSAEGNYPAVYKLDQAGNDTVLHWFTGLPYGLPYGPLLLTNTGALVGTALASGIFAILPNGTFDVVIPNAGANFGVIQDPASHILYGTGPGVPSHPAYGSIIEASLSSRKATTLYVFNWPAPPAPAPLGIYPVGPLVEDSSGMLYGTTSEGGLFNNYYCPSGCGVVFRLDRSGNYTVLYEFTGGADGFSPGPLSIDQQGNLYGVTSVGGDFSCVYAFGCGTVFKVTPPRVSISGSPQQPLSTNASGNFVANVTITNTGNVTVSSMQVTGATLGAGSLLSTPPAILNLAPGNSVEVTLTFPANSVPAGTASVPLKVSGTYSVTSPLLSGNWALSFRSVSL